MLNSTTDLQFSIGVQIAFRMADLHALCFRHEYVSTEHLLLGVFAERNGPAAKVLRARGVTYESIEEHITSIAQAGPEYPKIPPSLKRISVLERVMEHARQERESIGSIDIGTGELLLGMIREQESAAAQVLWNILGANPVTLRDEIIAAIRAGDS